MSEEQPLDCDCCGKRKVTKIINYSLVCEECAKVIQEYLDDKNE